MHVSYDFSLFYSVLFVFLLFFFLAFACLFLKRKRKGKAWSYMGGKVGRIWVEINEVKLIRIYNIKNTCN